MMERKNTFFSFSASVDEARGTHSHGTGLSCYYHFNQKNI